MSGPATDCAGRTSGHGCGARIVYAVSRPTGPGQIKTLHACGRHLSWLVQYMTVPGRSVTVTRLEGSG